MYHYCLISNMQRITVVLNNGLQFEIDISLTDSSSVLKHFFYKSALLLKFNDLCVNVICIHFYFFSFKTLNFDKSILQH